MVEVSSKEEDAADYHGALGNSDTYGYIILQRLVGKQYLRSIRCKADRMSAAVDLKLKLHVCLIYYNSQM